MFIYTIYNVGKLKHIFTILLIRVPHFATKHRNIVSQITLYDVSYHKNFFLFLIPLGSGRARLVQFRRKYQFYAKHGHFPVLKITLDFKIF